MGDINVSYKALYETLHLLRNDLGGDSLFNALLNGRKNFEQRCQPNTGAGNTAGADEVTADSVEIQEQTLTDLLCVDGAVQVSFESSETNPTVFVKAFADDPDKEKWLYLTNCTCMGFTNSRFSDPSQKSNNCSHIEPYWPKFLTVLASTENGAPSFDLNYNRYLGHVIGLRVFYECVWKKLDDHEDTKECLNTDEIRANISALKEVRAGYNRFQTNFKKLGSLEGEARSANLPEPPSLGLPSCFDIDWSQSHEMASLSDQRLASLGEYKVALEKITQRIPEYVSLRKEILKEENMIDLPDAGVLLSQISTEDRDITRILGTFETKIAFVKGMLSKIRSTKQKIENIYSDIKSHQNIVDSFDMSERVVDARILESERDPFLRLQLIRNEYDLSLLFAQKKYFQYLDALIKKYTTPVIKGLSKVRDKSVMEKVLKHVGISLNPLGGILPINIRSDGKDAEDIRNEQRMNTGERLDQYLKDVAANAENKWMEVYSKLPETEMEHNEVEYVKTVAQLDVVLKNFLDYYVYFTEFQKSDEDYEKIGSVYPQFTADIKDKIEVGRAPRECFVTR